MACAIPKMGMLGALASATSVPRAIGFSARYPDDPADRVIGATALVEGIPLVTADDAVLRSKEVPTIW